MQIHPLVSVPYVSRKPQAFSDEDIDIYQTFNIYND